MGEVIVTINGRRYPIACDDGQEDRIMRLAAHIDDHVAELGASVGNVGDARLLVMASLLVTDRLFDAAAEIERLRAQLTKARQAAAAETEAAVAPLVDAIARRIEDIAAQLESP